MNGTTYISRMIRTGALLPALVVLAAGCASAGYKKGDTAARGMQRAATEVQAETRAIDATMDALRELVNNPAPDLKPQFENYRSTLRRLVARANQSERTRARMERQGAEYFTAWDKETAEINYGIIRDRSESRRAEVTNHFHAVNSRYLEVQGVVRPLITYLEDIQTALSVDLTTAGLDSVKSIVSNAEQNARKVETALGRLSEELAASSTSLSSVATRDAGAPPSNTATVSKSE